MRQQRTLDVVVAWSTLLSVGLILACGGGSTGGPEERTVRQQSDRSGVQDPQRIIAIAPSVTEMLFELGLGERVVGVGDYAQWPPEVTGKPRLGGLFDARLETIASLSPDLAILLPSEQRLQVGLEEMGIEVLTVPSETIADVEEMAMLIGRRCGAEKQAVAFVQRFHRQLSPRTRSQSVRVLLSVTRQPGRMADVLVAGSDTFLSELIDRLGARNVMADTKMAYPQVGLEEIILRSPQVVIELQAAPGNFAALRADWLELDSEPALAGVCVKVVAGDHVLLPGPRLPRLYDELDQALVDCEEIS